MLSGVGLETGYEVAFIFGFKVQLTVSIGVFFVHN